MFLSLLSVFLTKIGRLVTFTCKEDEMSENLLSVQQYALKYKISTFAVIKLINTKKLKTLKKVIEEEEKEFIIDESLTQLIAPKIEKETFINYEVEFHKLLAKHLKLQEKYNALIEAKVQS